MVEKEASLVRWKIAQESEKCFWEGYSKETLLGFFEKGLQKKAEKLTKKFNSFKKINKNTRILQIGGAALDVINYIEIGDKYALDPLADYYKKKFNIDYKDVKFLKGVGENIPFKDDFFDIVILANVLDHVKSPSKVLDEVKRVLRPGGLMYLDAHYATKSFIKIAKIYSVYQKIFMKKIFNINHPYLFSKDEIKRLISTRFKILDIKLGEEYLDNTETLEEFKKAKKKDRRLAISILAYFGILAEINFAAYCLNNKN